MTALVDSLTDKVQTVIPLMPSTTGSKGYIFTSYAEGDSQFVDGPKGLFGQRGYAHWDYRESERDCHTALFLQLEQAIPESSMIACVLSPYWKRAKWTVRELFFTDEAGRPYLLLLSRETGPPATAGMTYIDFSKNSEDRYAALDRELTRKKLWSVSATYSSDNLHG